mmetsp:Transcript_8192/g.24372  ORF Transcript_8192/g.24372 Transcript_8192/m.24372 type:complete len:276 (-) Transcript_8192:278-1105(-)
MPVILLHLLDCSPGRLLPHAVVPALLRHRPAALGTPPHGGASSLWHPLLQLTGLVVLVLWVLLRLLLLLLLVPLETVAECWPTRETWLWLLVGVKLRSWVLALMLRRLVGEHGGRRLRGRVIEAHDQPAAVVRGIVGSVRSLPGHRGPRLCCLRQWATEALLSQLRLQCLIMDEFARATLGAAGRALQEEETVPFGHSRSWCLALGCTSCGCLILTSGRHIMFIWAIGLVLAGSTEEVDAVLKCPHVRHVASALQQTLLLVSAANEASYGRSAAQ